MAYFSKSKSGSPLSSVYFLSDVPNLPDSCCINFSGSSFSSASTPASKGSESSNGLSLPSSSPKPPSSDGASSKTSNDSSSPEAPKAGSLFGASSFSLYLVSSSRLYPSSSSTPMPQDGGFT
jgi:Tfp pilus tip-associated adhesin PilY1